MKLEDHLYLIKKEDGRYLLVYPVYDLNGDLDGWEDQNHQAYPYFDDDDIIGSVERIEERRDMRRNIEKKFLKEHED
jgi:uncharacterized protein (DUF1015 family)